jgi:simple sugar transport system permease protein
MLGISLVILGTGLSDLIYNSVVGLTLHAPIAPEVPIIKIPFISAIPLVSAFFNQNPIVYFMYFAVIVSWWFFYKTRVGLETRGIGENPRAIDVVGINVTARRYFATLVGSALIGIAGAYMPLIITSTYSTGITGGRGSMAIGIAIFAGWKPQRAIIGGFLFATIEVLAFQLQIISQQIPYQFLIMLPFISVLVIMIIFHGKLEFPASLGNPYKRE